KFERHCSSNVDLPMPGSPPSSTTWPPTSPPPSARSSSAELVERRGNSRVATSASATAVGAALLPWRTKPRSEIVSTSVPAAPQEGQLPNHCSAVAPQSEQV